MITRIVRLHIAGEKAENFKDLFSSIKEKIASHKGCLEVNAYEGEISGEFFTISKWTSEANLNDYRKSDLFGEVWPKVKTWLVDDPKAWTLNEI